MVVVPVRAVALFGDAAASPAMRRHPGFVAVARSRARALLDGHAVDFAWLATVLVSFYPPYAQWKTRVGKESREESVVRYGGWHVAGMGGQNIGSRHTASTPPLAVPNAIGRSSFPDQRSNVLVAYTGSRTLYTVSGPRLPDPCVLPH